MTIGPRLHLNPECGIMGGEEVKRRGLGRNMSGPQEVIIDDFERADTRMDLAPLLAQLPPRHREALLLWVDGHTQEEIGRMMGVAQPSIHRYIARAREELTRLGCIK